MTCIGTGSMVEWTYSSITAKEAIRIQTELRGLARIQDDFGRIVSVAGVDVRAGRGCKEAWCGIVVLSFPDLEVMEQRVNAGPLDFPYVPGLLAFRELPIFLETYRALRTRTDLLFFDGHGLAHPRRFGLACHAGVILDKPSIGCAKSRLIGDYAEPARAAGCTSELVAPEGDLIGHVVRTRTGVKPVFISPGHRVSFGTAVRLALACTRDHRIPEPTRLAHRLLQEAAAVEP
ncbi:MAG: endonuclease V [Armatimonadota bacterium]